MRRKMAIRMSLPVQLQELRPEAVTLLFSANDSVAKTMDPDLLQLLSARIDALIGDGSLSQKMFPDGLGDLSESQRVAINFAEQFIIDVSGITNVDRTVLKENFPDEQMRDFVTALYIMEFSYRLELIAGMLFGDELNHAVQVMDRTQTANVDARTNLKNYQDSVVRGTDLDPVTTELVRLRCARTHNCQICQTLRLANARADGADDHMTAKVDFYETSDLDEAHKIALRITDAFINRPEALTSESIVAAREIFEPKQLAELCLDITKWSTQKIHVALGTDSADSLPKNEQGLSFFGFDQEGRVTGYSASLD
jgi:alkylhydroperoxidase family enzyme